MRIGSHTLRNNLFVAPMAGVTDRPFRQLCKKFGAGLAVSEMVASNSLLWGSEKTLRRANHDGEVEPISVQIAGADPAMMAESARGGIRRHLHAGGSEASARIYGRRRHHDRPGRSRAALDLPRNRALSLDRREAPSSSGFGNPFRTGRASARALRVLRPGNRGQGRAQAYFL